MILSGFIIFGPYQWYWWLTCTEFWLEGVHDLTRILKPCPSLSFDWLWQLYDDGYFLLNISWAVISMFWSLTMVLG
jgi:hypothetical protein